MFADIINYVESRQGQYSRDVIKRETNQAWSDIWNSIDLPGSLQKMQVTDQCCADCNNIAKVTLPYFVQELRAAKAIGGPNVELNNPAYAFQAGHYAQMPLTWAFVEYTPLERWMGNTAPPLLKVTKPVTEQFSVVIIGGMKGREKVREEVVFTVGSTQQQAVTPFITYNSITKTALTETDIIGYDGAGEKMFTLPSATFHARNSIWQTRELTAYWQNFGWPWTCCWEILYKSTPNYLYYDEDCVLPNYEDAVQDAVVARLLLTEKGNEERAGIYYNASQQALTRLASSATKGQRNIMDLGPNRYNRVYWRNL